MHCNTIAATRKQNAVTEEKPTIETMIQSAVRANPNCANRNAKPISVPGDPGKSLILTAGGAGGPTAWYGGGRATGCTAG